MHTSNSKTNFHFALTSPKGKNGKKYLPPLLDIPIYNPSLEKYLNSHSKYQKNKKDTSLKSPDSQPIVSNTIFTLVAKTTPALNYPEGKTFSSRIKKICTFPRNPETHHITKCRKGNRFLGWKVFSGAAEMASGYDVLVRGAFGGRFGHCTSWKTSERRG